jgi:hypothetical protein
MKALSNSMTPLALQELRRSFQFAGVVTTKLRSQIQRGGQHNQGHSVSSQKE